MSFDAEAVVRDGQFYLKQPVALPEGTVVRLSITPVAESDDPLAGVIGICDDGPAVSLAERHDELSWSANSSRP